jgi:uncharacterized membrane protein
MKTWLLRHQKGVLWGAIFAYIVIFSAVSFWKYAIYAYDGIDLAYFNQVFWNSLHGRFFTQSIHPHRSLGDHAELIIPFLSLAYALMPGPKGLLFLQTLALGLAAWPLYLIARERLRRSKREANSLIALLVAMLWLINPLVQNINLFEFHILPFSLLPLFFSLYAYEKDRKLHFLLFAFVALLIREDVALVIALIGGLAWLERKSRWWHIAPPLIGLAWFFGAMRLIGHFAPSGSYKFLVYYAWLGDSFGGVLLGAMLHPLRLLAHILTLPNLEMIIGFGIPLLFLPYFRPRRLILALGPLLQIILGAPGGGELVLQTHYATLFLPGLFLAGIDGLIALRHRTRPFFALRSVEFFFLARAIVVIAAVYGMLALGPLPSAVAAIAAGTGRETARLADALVAKIPPDAPVAASYRLMPRLSSRARLVSLHYVFLGVTQFGEAPYPLPEDVRYVALDTDDLRTYQAQFLRTAWAMPHYVGGYGRLRALVGGPAYAEDRYVLYVRGHEAEPSLETDLLPVADQDFRDGIVLTGAAATLDARTFTLRTSWSDVPSAEDGTVIRIRLRDAGGVLVLDRSFPFGNDLEATLHGSLRVTWDGRPGVYVPEVLLEHEKTTLVLNGIRSGERLVEEATDLGRATLPAIKVER